MKAVWLLREGEDIRSFWELLDLSGWDEFFVPIPLYCHPEP